jgi:hypothetical protein
MKVSVSDANAQLTTSISGGWTSAIVAAAGASRARSREESGLAGDERRRDDTGRSQQGYIQASGRAQPGLPSTVATAAR